MGHKVTRRHAHRLRATAQQRPTTSAHQKGRLDATMADTMKTTSPETAIPLDVLAITCEKPPHNPHCAGDSRDDHLTANAEMPGF